MVQCFFCNFAYSSHVLLVVVICFPILDELTYINVFPIYFDACVQAVASDLEQKLLSCMVNMLDDPSKKVQTVKSWGWIVSLLGPDAVNNRPLLNKLIKVPEQMFTDLNPQVQVATMVS